MDLEAARSTAQLGEDAAALVARYAAEKHEALARLAAGIAHELRNPLAVILARVQLLQLAIRDGKPPEREKLERTLRTVEEQAVRASNIIESLSIFARPRRPDLRSVDLVETVDHVLAALRGRMPAGARVATEVDVASEARALVADRDQLAAALTQLVTNALDAMPDGGVLRVRARRADGATEIVVADTGPGVPEHDAPRIFDLFFSTKPAAAGLVLCVARTIAEAHGGSLRLRAPGRRGAEFVLSLPVRG